MRFFVLFCCLFSTQVFAVKVAVQPLSEVVSYPTLFFPATVVSHTESAISSETNGRLISVNALPGQTIQKDSVLAEFDCRDAQDNLEMIRYRQSETESRLDLTQLQLDRFKKLESRQYASTSQLDETQTQLVGIKASLAGLKVEKRLAQRGVNRCVLKAPFTGVVKSKQASQGQWLSTGQPVVTLVKRDQLEVETALPQTLANALSQGLEIFKWQSVPSNSLSGGNEIHLKRVSDLVSGNKGMVPVWFTAPENVRVGALGQVLVKSEQAHLSASHIVKRDGKLGVFVINDNQTIRFEPLTQGSAGRSAVVPKHWKLTWKIVTAGQLRLQANDTVTVEK